MTTDPQEPALHSRTVLAMVKGWGLAGALRRRDIEAFKETGAV